MNSAIWTWLNLVYFNCSSIHYIFCLSLDKVSHAMNAMQLKVSLKTKILKTELENQLFG